MDEVSMSLALLMSAPIVIGLVEVIKRAVRLADRYVPVVAIVTAFALQVLAQVGGVPGAPETFNVAYAMLGGIVSGLAASGLFSQSKAVAGN